MRGRPALIVVALFVWFVSVGPARAQQPSQGPDPLIARLQTRLDRLKTLQGRFIQTLESTSLGRTRTEQGRFMIRKPNLMRWEYESPEKKLAVMDGTHTWLYLPDDKEVQRGPAASVEQSGAAALLLAGRLRLDRDFRSRRPGTDEIAAELPMPDRTVVVELTPVRPDLDFEKALLAVDPDALLIRKVVLVDPLGDRMIFTFSELKEDAPLPDSLFRFEPPAGVSVTDVEPGPR